MKNKKYDFEKSKGGMELDLIEKTFSASHSFCLLLTSKFKPFFEKSKQLMKFDIPIIPGIDFAISFEPFINAKMCLDLGYYQNLSNSNDTYFFINFFGEAEVGVNLEAGIQIPSSKSQTFFGIFLGLQGVLGSGKIGIKLQFFFKGEKRNQFGFDSYYELQALSLSFYIKFHIQVSLGNFFNYSLEFYILRVPLIAYKKEFHKIRKYNNTEQFKCEEKTIEGWNSIFIDKDIEKISPCK